MLGWLHRWRQNRARAIFHYWDGSKPRAIDPMVVYRTLISDDDFDWAKDPKGIDQLESDDPGMREFASECTERTLWAIRNTFGVDPFDPESDTGLTESETLNLLISFVDYLQHVKKNTGETLISPDPTGSKSSEQSTTKPVSV